jgi:alcohol dehydrogenase (cytochrome c)
VIRNAVILVLAAGVLAAGQGDEAGGEAFERRCASCHGSDGAGGERGPDIVNDFRFRRQSAEELGRVIRKGVPEGGMPGFRLSDSELGALVSYVAGLRAPAGDHPAAGDAAAGERYFHGEGKCAGCHSVTGPDLSNLARERTRGQIEQALRHPESLNTPGYRMMSVRTRDGRRLRGFAKNESNYDLQLQTLDGTLHFLSAAEIVERVREGSPMPAFRGPAKEYGDLLAYLTRLDGRAVAAVPAGRGIPFERVAHPERGEWPTYNGHLSGNRHSALDQINVGNVHRLAPRWVFPISGARRLEVTPVVVDGVMYVTSGNAAFALDARSGRQIWSYSRPLTQGVIGDAAGGINRGVAVLGERVFLVTDHAHLIALDRRSGRLAWDVEMADYREHYGATSAPLAVNDLVISGTSGGDEGARGFIAAYKAATGERVWRFWTMPARRGDPGSETWTGRAMEHGCTAAWLTGTYDSETGLLYWTTGNPCPDYNGDERKGDNLYSDSVVALEAATGRLRWYFQFTPHDLHDWDAAQTPLLADMNFRGRPRKLLLQANRNGFFYVLDRETGEFLLGEPFVKKLTWAKGLDAKGRPIPVPGNDPTPQGTRTCPAVEGATNWMSTAFHPEERLYYVMALEACGIYTKSAAWWEPGKSFYGGGARRVPGEERRKVLRAIDPETGRIAWEYPQRGEAVSWGGVLSTAGGLVFFGDDSGAFAAVNAANGKPLWHFHTGQIWKASPMTFAIDGTQYVAVAAGGNILCFSLVNP